MENLSKFCGGCLPEKEAGGGGEARRMAAIANHETCPQIFYNFSVISTTCQARYVPDTGLVGIIILITIHSSPAPVRVSPGQVRLF